MPETVPKSPLDARTVNAVTRTDTKMNGTVGRCIQNAGALRPPALDDPGFGKVPAVRIARRNDGEVRSYRVCKRYAGRRHAAMVWYDDNIAGNASSVLNQGALGLSLNIARQQQTVVPGRYSKHARGRIA